MAQPSENSISQRASIRVVSVNGIIRKKVNLRDFDYKDNLYHQGRNFDDKWLQRRSKFTFKGLPVYINCQKTLNLCV